VGTSIPVKSIAVLELSTVLRFIDVAQIYILLTNTVLRELYSGT
jgi:hypothetical protein